MKGFLRVVMVATAFAAPASAAPVPTVGKADDSPVAKARKALDETADLKWESATFDDFVKTIKSRFGIEIMIDHGALLQMGMNRNVPAITATLKGVKLRDGLKTALAPLGLRTALTAQGLVISSEEGVIAMQMRQAVRVDGDGGALTGVLKRLSAETAANIVLDPRLDKKFLEAPIGLKFDDVPLETAVRLIAEVGGLRAVRMNNVLFVTSEDRAAKLRPDADGPVPPTPASPFPLPDEDPLLPVPVPPAAR